MAGTDGAINCIQHSKLSVLILQQIVWPEWQLNGFKIRNRQTEKQKRVGWFQPARGEGKPVGSFGLPASTLPPSCTAQNCNAKNRTAQNWNAQNCTAQNCSAQNCNAQNYIALSHSALDKIALRYLLCILYLCMLHSSGWVDATIRCLDSSIMCFVPCVMHPLHSAKNCTVSFFLYTIHFQLDWTWHTEHLTEQYVVCCLHCSVCRADKISAPMNCNVLANSKLVSEQKWLQLLHPLHWLPG